MSTFLAVCMDNCALSPLVAVAVISRTRRVSKNMLVNVVDKLNRS